MVNVHDVDSTEQMMRFLNSGHVDVALTNTIDGVHMIEKLGLDKIQPLDTPLAVLELYHYIHKSHIHLVPKVDAVIKQMTLSGEMQHLIEKSEREVIEHK
nr:transporter substrate-binding domain-containing protein [Shewanella psychrophila]